MAKFDTSKMHRILNPPKNVPANNCHLKVPTILVAQAKSQKKQTKAICMTNKVRRGRKAMQGTHIARLRVIRQ